jgi:hypothetical protein
MWGGNNWKKLFIKMALKIGHSQKRHEPITFYGEFFREMFFKIVLHKILNNFVEHHFP